MKRQEEERNRGITLIALVITIIVLLILAAVSIAMLTGSNGLLTRAEEAKKQTEKQETVERINLAISDAYTRGFGEINENNLDEAFNTEFGAGKYEKKVENDTYTITINGESKEITIHNTSEVKEINAQVVSQNPNQYYGAKITNYEAPNGWDGEWRIFHADNENIYLIAADYIELSYIPYSTNNGETTTNKPAKGSYACSVQLGNVLNDYNGSSDINSTHPAYKWLNEYNKLNTQSDSKNMKVTAYLLDTLAWQNFKSNEAEYAIGAPTVEMFAKSYNAINSDRATIDFKAESKYGYQVKFSNQTSYTTDMYGLNNNIGTTNERIICNKGY